MAPEQRSWWFWAGCAAAGACTYYVLRPKQRSGADDTDFAGFLADPSTLAAPRARVPPPPRRDETGFDAFLRVTPAAAPLDPTGFDSFLRAKPAAPGAPLAAAGAAAAKQQQQEEEPLPLDRAGVLVMYGTEYGFSKEIAEKLVGRLKGGDAFWCAAARIGLVVVCGRSGAGSTVRRPRAARGHGCVSARTCLCKHQHAYLRSPYSNAETDDSDSKSPSPPPQAQAGQHGGPPRGLPPGGRAGGAHGLLHAGAAAGQGVIRRRTCGQQQHRWCRSTDGLLCACGALAHRSASGPQQRPTRPPPTGPAGRRRAAHRGARVLRLGLRAEGRAPGRRELLGPRPRRHFLPPLLPLRQAARRGARGGRRGARRGAR